MKRCVFDIEGDELLIRCSVVWCVVIKDLQTGETFKYRPDQIPESYRKLQEYDLIIGHNILGYDVPVMEKFYGHLGPLPKRADTFIMSRMMWGPGEAPGEAHGLAAWGRFFNFPKIEFEDFSKFSEEMLTYCTQDVDLNVKVYGYIRERWKPELNYGYQMECDARRIITMQEQNGFRLDPNKYSELVQFLNLKLAEAQDEVDKVIPPTTYTVKRHQFFTAVKEPSLIGPGRSERFLTKKDAKAAGFKDKEIIPGPLVEKTQTFNPNSGKQILEYFQDRYKWQPTVFTENGNPSVSGQVLEDLEYPEAELFSEFQLVKKRISQVESWDKFRIGDRVHGSVHTVGTHTYRMSHSEPNVAQVTAKRKKYGKECRECWVPKPGWKLVGTDAKGLELRLFANELAPFDGGKYIDVVCLGDPHSHNQMVAGLDDRDLAKTCIYAFTYGGGLLKLGDLAKDSQDIIKESANARIPDGYKRYMKENDLYTEENVKKAKRGIVLKDRFMSNIEGFADALQALEEEWEANDQKWIRGIDGRRIPVTSRNILLNRKLQSGGAIVMKEALRIHERLCVRDFGPHGERWAYCANIHDEFQVECEASIAKRMRAIGRLSIYLAGEALSLHCRQAGDSQIGESWLGTH